VHADAGSGECAYHERQTRLVCEGSAMKLLLFMLAIGALLAYLGIRTPGLFSALF